MAKGLAGVDSTKGLVQIPIMPYSNKCFQIGKSLSTEDRVEILLSLIQNMDMVAWGPYEVLVADSNFIMHKLNVDPQVPQKKIKKKKKQNKTKIEEVRKTPHVEAKKEKVEKLKRSGAIKEVFFPEWLAKTVVVKKKNGKWRVCVDFTNLNRACLKDRSKIDQLVDTTIGHQRMRFLDAFQGYHQIALAPEDQENTSFITPEGNYHYTMMPFELKNAGATYQRMVTRMFTELISKTVEVYINDVVVKMKERVGHACDLVDVFDILR